MADDPITFDINGVSYQARRLDLLTQLAIVAKLGPLMASGLSQILQLFDTVAEEASGLPAEAKALTLVAHVLALPKGKLIEQFAPLMGELAKMPPADQQFIISSTLAVVQRNVGTPGGAPQWETIWPAGLSAPGAAEFRGNLWLTLRVVGATLAPMLWPFT